MGGGCWLFGTASYATDLVSLSLLAEIMKPSVVFEIGTLSGYTAYQFALNTPDDTKIFTLDLPKDSSEKPFLNTTAVDDFHIYRHQKRPRYCFKGKNIESKITCLFGDSATFDFSPFYNTVDLFFIDGAHSYEYVKSDTLNGIKCCCEGAYIAWHDYGRMGVNGVSKYLTELSKDHEIYSVPGGSLAFMQVKG